MWKLLEPRSTAARTSGTGRSAARTADFASASRAVTAVGTRTRSSRRERGPATAGGGRVGVANHELRAVEPLAVVDLRAAQVLHAHGVDDELHPEILDADVAFLQLLVELEAVLQPRAAPALHEHAQHELRIAFAANQITDLARGGIGEQQRGRSVLQGVGGGHNLPKQRV